ncbi:hypothetical protein QR680_008025 [Steinernema hermaphroditum]|uniref:Uncharacterized protein n=1 Tax=Steinernema hermaphroditum TaxID=289476 RepID=A0AA39IF17_9BILA|nr:hypothetical protein QR680_008025 [Steinernema hermaphroditum]
MELPSDVPTCDSSLPRADQNSDESLHDAVKCAATSSILGSLPIEIVCDIFSINLDVQRSDFVQLEGPFGQIAQEKPKVAYVSLQGMFRSDPSERGQDEEPEPLREMHQLNGVRIKEVSIYNEHLRSTVEPDWQAIKLAMKAHYEKFELRLYYNKPLVDEMLALTPSAMCQKVTITSSSCGVDSLNHFVGSFLRQRHEHRISLTSIIGKLNKENVDCAFKLFLSDKMECLMVLRHSEDGKITERQFEELLDFFLNRATGDYYCLTGKFLPGELTPLLLLSKGAVEKEIIEDYVTSYTLTRGDVVLDVRLKMGFGFVFGANFRRIVQNN